MVISPPMIAIALSSLTISGGAAVAWADVKSDIAVVQEKTEANEKKYEKIDQKLDKIIEHLLKDGDDS